jgi:hypothetical protein
LIEGFMDIPPSTSPGENAASDRDALREGQQRYQQARKRLEDTLAAEGLQYFRGGRIIPTGTTPEPVAQRDAYSASATSPKRPTSIDEVLLPLFRGLRRAMFPLTHRRKGLPTLTFDNEYDIQDLLHVLLRPWVKDIRPEEYTPSYGGKSTRMDFLLPDHATVVELKLVRDAAHGKNVGQELLVDIGHYRQHPKCELLWCVVLDPNHYLVNSNGLGSDLEGEHRQEDKSIQVKVLVL